MKNDLKSFLINVVAGLLTYYVTKYLDNNKFQSLSYVVFASYILFIFCAAYFHIKNSAKISRNILEQSAKKKSDQDKNNCKPEIFHKILKCVVKLASQHADPSPKKIGELIGENPQIVLAYLKEMEGESLVVYVSGGKPPDINTPFHVAYHENPWKYIEMKPCQQPATASSPDEANA
jgi:hypothetical protein